MRRPFVVVTREEGPGDGLRGALAERGCDSKALPTTRTAAPDDAGPLAQALSELGSFAWLVVTSTRAVEALTGHAAWRGVWESGAHPRVAAVGCATAARLQHAGARVDLVSAGPGGVALAEGLIAAQREALRGARVLWPRSDRARPDLAARLEAAGAHVVAPVAYRTLPVRPHETDWFTGALRRGAVDVVAFLSPSAAFGLASALEEKGLIRLRDQAAVASLGPTTSAALASLGAPAHVESQHPEPHAFAEAMLAFLGSRQGAMR